MPYLEIEYVRRDVSYFLHLQAEYSFLQEDLDWSLFLLPYWEYLDETSIDGRDERELRDGCLAVILAMAMAGAGNIADPLGERLDACRRSLESFHPTDESGAHLAQLARFALGLAAVPNERRDFDALRGIDVRWVHDHVVRGYFRARAGR